jgi:hypothetical protein
MIFSVAASSVVRITATTQKTRGDQVRFRRLGDRLKTIAREEKQYVEKQFRSTVRKHARTQSTVKKIIEEVKAEFRDYDARSEEDNEDNEDGIDSLGVMKEDEKKV